MNLANEKHATSVVEPSRVLGTLSKLVQTAAGNIAPHIVCGLLGLLCPGIVFAHYAPFRSLRCRRGALFFPVGRRYRRVIGYLIPGNAAVPIHYIAAVLACAAIRWTLNDLLKLRAHPAFARWPQGCRP